jgi:hypothetical protein
MLTQQLTAIAQSFTHPDAIEALNAIYADPDNTPQLIKAAFIEVDRSLQARLRDIFLDREALGEFKIGDRVMIQSESIPQKIINRGRVRSIIGAGRLWRRVGAAKEIKGSVTARGSRKLLYIKAKNIGVDVETIDLCLYPSLKGTELIIDSICYPYLACKRSSGTDTPGLLKTDLQKIC